MKLELLVDHKDAIPIIAGWYFVEWGHLETVNSIKKITENLNTYLNKNQVPLIVLAVEGKEILGVAQLKFREMDIYPDKEHWLGGVYVVPKHRGRKIAAKMVGKVLSIAESFKVKTLFLQTENLNGGLYKHLGWRPFEQVNYHGTDVLVMQKQLGES